MVLSVMMSFALLLLQWSATLCAFLVLLQLTKVKVDVVELITGQGRSDALQLSELSPLIICSVLCPSMTSNTISKRPYFYSFPI